MYKTSCTHHASSILCVLCAVACRRSHMCARVYVCVFSFGPYKTAPHFECAHTTTYIILIFTCLCDQRACVFLFSFLSLPLAGANRRDDDARAAGKIP